MKEKMQQLIDKLNEATKTYDEGHPIMTDKEWDDMYFELIKLERETGIAFFDSPAHSIPFAVVNELKKVKHNHDMLSLDKTKKISVVESFLKGHDWITMAKMDGLTCSLRYLNGELVSAETRGDGKIGEDILHNAKVIPSIPKHIDFKEELIVDGEIICTYKDFEEFKDEYKNPRNFAAGSIRLLDSGECFNRKLTFVAWDVVKGGKYEWLSDNLLKLKVYGFKVVPMFINNPEDSDSIENYIDPVKKKSHELSDSIDGIVFKSHELSYPIDGVVFKYDNIEEYKDAGRTDHHFKGGLAYKFYDETYSTRLKYITWSMGRSGVLTPVAVFDPVIIDGAEVTKASLHNVSIMKETLGDCAYFGEPLEVTKMNMIIPQIISAGPKYDYGYIISHGGVSANDTIERCPYCGKDVSYRTENGVTRVFCDNPACEGKTINILDHFASKKGLEIKGLSKMTLEKLIDWGWLATISDIFKLKDHRDEWTKKSGFGTASVNKILSAIEESKNCSTDKFICAIGIPLIGKVASNALAGTFGTYNNFRKAIENKDEKLYQIAGIGEVMIETILNFDYTEADETFKFINEIPAATSSTNGNELEGKVFCITGKLRTFKNRDELKSFIESKGGKVTGSVTSKTSYLINNDTESTTAKNQTAKKMGIPIIGEEEFKKLLNI